MKRTTIYLDPELEMMVKQAAVQNSMPVAALIRQTLRQHLSAGPKKVPPGAGAFDSGFTDTAERAEDVLMELGFGEDS